MIAPLFSLPIPLLYYILVYLLLPLQPRRRFSPGVAPPSLPVCPLVAGAVERSLVRAIAVPAGVAIVREHPLPN